MLNRVKFQIKKALGLEFTMLESMVIEVENKTVCAALVVDFLDTNCFLTVDAEVHQQVRLQRQF